MIKRLHFFMLFSLLFFYGSLYAQININTQGTVSICADTWTDSGGSTGNYSNSENFTQTLCPANAGEVMTVSFSSFLTESCCDILSYYNDDVADPSNQLGTGGGIGLDGALLAANITTDNPNGCLTFAWSTDGGSTESGWEATLACAVPCSAPTAVMSTSAFAVECSANSLTPGAAVSFDGSGSTASAGNSIVTYEWDFGDGVIQTTTTPTTTHTYSTSGAFLARLSVIDDYTATMLEGCRSENETSRTIFITDLPDFSSTSADTIIEPGESVTLDGVATSTPLIQGPPVVNIPPTALPDGSGVSYEIELNYTGIFPPGSTVTAACLPSLCVNLEHDFAGDILLDLRAPDGTTVRLMNSVNSGNHLGNCVNDADNGIPGCTAEYCFDDNAATSIVGAPTTAPNANGTCAAYSGACASRVTIIPDSYIPENSFAGFLGVPLNGVWTIIITDDESSDDGSIDGASLTFPISCYPPFFGLTPDLNIDATTAWTADPSNPSAITIPAQTNTSTPFSSTRVECGNITPADACDGNTVTNTINLGPFPIEGTYTFTYTVTDDEGCVYEEDVVVTVDVNLPLNLEYFSGKWEGSIAQLNWAVSAINNVKGIEIQRATNGVDFEKIGWENLSGTTISRKEFSFDDVSKKSSPIYYYRLKIIDEDLRFEYSDVIALSYSTENPNSIVALAPNPVSSYTNLTYNAKKNQPAKIYIHDVAGKVIMEKDVDLFTGIQTLRLDLSELNNGFYYLSVVNETGITDAKSLFVFH